VIVNFKVFLTLVKIEFEQYVWFANRYHLSKD